MDLSPKIIDWLLKSDPAIRWQVMQDLVHAPPALCAQERAQLAHTGWCVQLLQRQAEDGLWNHSLYNGKWLSTTYTLYLLKLFGLPPGHPQSLKGCEQLLTQGLYQGREIRFSRNQESQDLGVSALVLSLCCYFGCKDESILRLADFIVHQQTNSGNWLPNATPMAAAYTFETTLLVLEALLQYHARHPAGKRAASTRAVMKGQEFLLKHDLYLDKGKPIKSNWTSFSFPPYWFYDVLTALDYFRSFKQSKNKRLQTGIDLLLKRQSEDGTWALGARHVGKTYFDMEQPGEPSRWNTLRALRVLEWREGE